MTAMRRTDYLPRSTFGRSFPVTDQDTSEYTTSTEFVTEQERLRNFPAYAATLIPSGEGRDEKPRKCGPAAGDLICLLLGGVGLTCSAQQDLIKA